MRRRVTNRGLLDYPLRKVVKRYCTEGGNPNTNPPRTTFTLECGHKVTLTGWHEKKAMRCDECPKKSPKKERCCGKNREVSS